MTTTTRRSILTAMAMATPAAAAGVVPVFAASVAHHDALAAAGHSVGPGDDAALLAMRELIDEATIAWEAATARQAVADRRYFDARDAGATSGRLQPLLAAVEEAEATAESAARRLSALVARAITTPAHTPAGLRFKIALALEDLAEPIFALSWIGADVAPPMLLAFGATDDALTGGVLSAAHGVRFGSRPLPPDS